jgi:digeranylgeranylglycerophospholipid reductase
MRLIDCDVVVVGGGPAGSSAARAAAAKGAHVVVLEEHPVIGSPVFCAEGLSLGGIKDAGLEPVAPLVAQKIDCARVVAPNGNHIDLTSGNWVGYTLNRNNFDKAIGDLAVKAGAELLTDTKATGVWRENGKVAGVMAESHGEDIKVKAKVTIGADGYWSIVRRSAGMARWYPDIVTCAQFMLEDIHIDTPTTNEFYVGMKYAPGGYAWVFPKNNHCANIGLGVRNIHTEPAINYLKRFIDADPRFKGARVVRRNGGVTPVSGMLDKIVDDNLMLVGDAAGQLVPMTGAGIHSGIEAGKMAGAEAVDAIVGEDTSAKRLGEYRTKFEKYWGKRIKDSRKIVEMLDKFSDEDLNELSTVITNDEILSLANGEGTKKTLAKIVARSPGKIMRLMAAYLK